jgi:deoxycytidine triphosphate deaminase
MSIKSDKWIRRMAAEHGMIEPLEPQLVREAGGQKIVSYGASSYGYDIRRAPKFKVFTNINSTVVAPKAFDPKSFVEIARRKSASSRPIPLRLPARSNISAFLAMCSPSAWARALTPAAASP